jgi:hypothetical protein
MKMKFLSLKLNKEKLPQLGSLRPPIFPTEKFWFYTLGLCLAIILLTAFIGGKIFYSQYFETYKKSGSSENYDNLINMGRLKATIEKRNEFLNQEVSIPKDPSL